MRILFMGTPDFAAVSLKRLVEDGHELCGVFTQPDKPRNRNKVTFSPVKEYALSHGLTAVSYTHLASAACAPVRRRRLATPLYRLKFPLTCACAHRDNRSTGISKMQ